MRAARHADADVMRQMHILPLPFAAERRVYAAFAFEAARSSAQRLIDARWRRDTRGAICRDSAIISQSRYVAAASRFSPHAPSARQMASLPDGHRQGRFALLRPPFVESERARHFDPSPNEDYSSRFLCAAIYTLMIFHYRFLFRYSR